MSNRKENMKKTLGITEYPWSSDDEENEGATAVQDVQVIRRQRNEAEITPPTLGHVPGTSAQPSTSSSQNAARRNQLFWSLSLGNPHRISSVSLPRPSSRIDVPLSLVSRQLERGGPERPGSAGASDARLASDVQRILAFRKLNRNPSSYRPCRTNLYALQRSNSARSRRDEISALMRAGRERIYERPPPDHPPGNDPSLNQAGPGEPQASTSGYSRRSTLPVIRLENIEPVTLEPSDDGIYDVMSDVDLLQNSLSAPPAANRTDVNLQPDVSTEADGSHNVSGISMEEEIVEIDAEPEAAAAGDAGAGGDPRPSEEAGPSQEPVANTSATSEEQHPSPHGVKRKRESIDDSNEPASVREFNQSLLRLLECPVCLEWMEPPMSQCRRGHLVCTRCRARLAACPVCRTAFSSVRNRAMEGVAEMLRYPCRHGCGRDLRLRRRGAHEASCAARRYRCPAPACVDRAPLPHAELGHHCQGKHPSMVKYGRKHKFSTKVNSELHDNWVIMALHELFHLRVDVDIRTWGVVVYVAYIGPKCNASNYTYEVSVSGQHNSRKLIYSRATHCDLECSSLNVSRQDCFHLTLDQALNFLRVKNRHCEPDKFLNFSVEITKVENENREESDS